MASSNMKDIKRRIKSVESTMQITKAMELVASSKLRKAKDKADRARPFFNTLYETMCEISADNNEFTSVFTQKRKVNSALLIVVAGDRGLAGGFNGNILKLAQNHADELIRTGIKVKIFAVGKKAVEYFDKRQFEVIGRHAGIAESLNIYDAVTISDSIVDGYRKKDFDKVELFFTTFVSALSQEPKKMAILPVEIGNSERDRARQLTTYDPSPEVVFNDIVPKYISGLVFGSIVDSFASEQASRRTAMESASDNAGEMIDNLSLIYNRARQSTITQEITEIVGGAQAQA